MDKAKQVPNMDTAKVVYVEWVDAVADLGWQTLPIIAATHLCKTIGYLVDENKEAICIASTISISDTNARMHIPKAWIKNRRYIETKQRKIKGTRIAAVGSRPTNIEVSN